MSIFKRFLQSSANPQELALTVRGFLVGLIPLCLIIAKLLGADFLPTDLEPYIDVIVNLVVAIVGVISAGMTIYGLGRKVVYWFKNK